MNGTNVGVAEAEVLHIQASGHGDPGCSRLSTERSFHGLEEGLKSRLRNRHCCLARGSNGIRRRNQKIKEQAD
jgi:hypothetical protein